MADVFSSDPSRRLLKAFAAPPLVAVAYFATGLLGLGERIRPGGVTVTPLYPPTGVALAALFFFGIRVWWGITLGALLLLLLFLPLHVDSLCLLVGSTVAPVLAYLLLRRAGFDLRMARLRDGLMLVFLGALLPMTVSASINVGVQAVAGTVPARDFWTAWCAWWTGDAMGILVVSPLIFVLRGFRLPPLSLRWLEAAALLLSTAAVALLATRSPTPILFLMFPMLIWAALRFQHAGSAPATLIVSVFAITAATRGLGPFDQLSVIEVTVGLQALNGCAALTSLLLSAMVTEQLDVRRKIERLCLELAEVVDHLAPGRSKPLRDVVRHPGEE